MATVYKILKAPSAPSSGMGANLLSDGTGVSFRVWAPNASAVRVLLRASDAESYQSLDLAPDLNNANYYSADVRGAGREHQYRFSIDNNRQGPDNPGGVFERVDPYARDVETSDADAPGFITNPAFEFIPFQSPRFEDYLIYQLHIGSFAGLGDGLANQVANRTAAFRQIADNKLDYVRSMNFNAVEFLPTTQTPFKTSEGYVPSNFFSPEVDYGDPDDLCYLIDQCHRRGLAVILDVVYNHVVEGDAFNRLLTFDGNTVNRNRGVYFSAFDNFGNVTLDAGAIWTLEGSNTVSTMQDNGAVHVNGSLKVADLDPSSSGFLILKASSTLELGAASGAHTAVNFLGGGQLLLGLGRRLLGRFGRVPLHRGAECSRLGQLLCNRIRLGRLRFGRIGLGQLRCNRIGLWGLDRLGRTAAHQAVLVHCDRHSGAQGSGWPG